MKKSRPVSITLLSYSLIFFLLYRPITRIFRYFLFVFHNNFDLHATSNFLIITLKLIIFDFLGVKYHGLEMAVDENCLINPSFITSLSALAFILVRYLRFFLNFTLLVASVGVLRLKNSFRIALIAAMFCLFLLHALDAGFSITHFAWSSFRIKDLLVVSVFNDWTIGLYLLFMVFFFTRKNIARHFD